MSELNDKVMTWWNGLSSLRKTQLCDTNTETIGSVRRWETLTELHIGYLWAKYDENAKKCDTFKINEKVSYKQENKSAYNLTVINNRGVYINGNLHIPCGSEGGLIDDYPVIYLSPSNVEKAKEWWKKINTIRQRNLVDVESMGDYFLLRDGEIEKLWDKYNNGGDVTKSVFTYEDMMACYVVGVSDGMESVATNERVNTIKGWLNENYG